MLLLFAQLLLLCCWSVHASHALFKAPSMYLMPHIRCPLCIFLPYSRHFLSCSKHLHVPLWSLYWSKISSSHIFLHTQLPPLMFKTWNRKSNDQYHLPHNNSWHLHYNFCLYSTFYIIAFGLRNSIKQCQSKLANNAKLWVMKLRKLGKYWIIAFDVKVHLTFVLIIRLMLFLFCRGFLCL